MKHAPKTPPVFGAEWLPCEGFSSEEHMFHFESRKLANRWLDKEYKKLPDGWSFDYSTVDNQNGT